MSQAPTRFFSLDSHPKLAGQVADYLDLPVESIELKHFADGEIALRLDKTVRGAHVFVMQSLSQPVSDRLMALLMFLDAARRASAKTITVIVPYLAYSRSDRLAAPREPIVAKLAAELLESQGATRVVTIDLHAPQVQGFFDIPVDHLLAAPVLAHHFFENGQTESDVVVAAPDHTSAGRAQKMAKLLEASWGVVDRREVHVYPKKPLMVTGDIAGKHAILLDDMIDTGFSMRVAAEALHAAGATQITAVATHGLFTDHAIEQLQAAPIDQILVTDTIAMREEVIQALPITVVSVAQLLAGTIDGILNNTSIEGLLKSPDNPNVKL
jgi:ribose-phosphate pyrophosphokinase